MRPDCLNSLARFPTWPFRLVARLVYHASFAIWPRTGYECTVSWHLFQLIYNWHLLNIIIRLPGFETRKRTFWHCRDKWWLGIRASLSKKKVKSILAVMISKNITAFDISCSSFAMCKSKTVEGKFVDCCLIWDLLKRKMTTWFIGSCVGHNFQKFNSFYRKQMYSYGMTKFLYTHTKLAMYLDAKIFNQNHYLTESALEKTITTIKLTCQLVVFYYYF